MKPDVRLNGQEVGRLLRDEVVAEVEMMALRYQRLPVEPRLDKESGTIIPEENGCIVDVDKTVEKVMAAREGQELDLVYVVVYSRYRGEDLQMIGKVRGHYETYFSGTAGRWTNISLAVQSINNLLLFPGDIFSFNDAVGPRTAVRGYMPAPVIISGHKENDFGGGVCQVSSTIFNAAERAGMEIIERHPHTRPVRYVPQGRDAAVDYGFLDLKFKNVLNTPVIVKAGCGHGKIWVEILGR